MKEIPIWESNSLGGASAINGCVHVVGNELSWGVQLEKFNFKYKDLTEQYASLYSRNIKEKNKIVLMQSFQNIIDFSFIDSLKRIGIPYGEIDFSNKIKCGPIWNTVKKYLRSSVLDYINEDKFEIKMNERVNDIKINEFGKIEEVETNSKSYKADYFILSSGTLGTNELLLNLSLKIPDKINNIGLGIKDHSNLRVNIFTNKSIGSLNEIYHSFIRKLTLGLKHIFGLSTLMSETGATSAVQLDLDGDGLIDTRIHIVQYVDTGRHDIKNFFSKRPGFSLSITPISPQSRGEVILIMMVLKLILIIYLQ